MLEDQDPLVGRYEERGVPTDWQEITPPSLAPAFRLWYRALPSPKSKDLKGAGQALRDAADEAELLIHDPLVALQQAGIAVDSETRIASMVVNHEKTLNRYIMYAMVVVSSNPHTVGITLVKEEE